MRPAGSVTPAYKLLRSGRKDTCLLRAECNHAFPSRVQGAAGFSFFSLHPSRYKGLQYPLMPAYCIVCIGMRADAVQATGWAATALSNLPSSAHRQMSMKHGTARLRGPILGMPI